MPTHISVPMGKLIDDLEKGRHNMRKVLTTRNYSGHPGDWYLKIVLCQVEEHPNSKYATYMYNSIDNTYYHGHYFKDLAMAHHDYEQRNR